MDMLIVTAVPVVVCLLRGTENQMPSTLAAWPSKSDPRSARLTDEAPGAVLVNADRIPSVFRHSVTQFDVLWLQTPRVTILKGLDRPPLEHALCCIRTQGSSDCTDDLVAAGTLHMPVETLQQRFTANDPEVNQTSTTSKEKQLT